MKGKHSAFVLRISYEELVAALAETFPLLYKTEKWNNLRWPYHRAQGWPLGGASGALAPGADFEGAPKWPSPPGHTLIRSTVAWCRISRCN
jgi:hypothetical protein